MTSTVKIYKTKIIPEKNFVVDDIEAYLATCDVITITNFQYQKYESANKVIKIDKNQVFQEFDTDSEYNYVSIKNSDSSKIVYYFLINKPPRAEETIRLELIMDTANTFKPGEDFTILNKTKISRQHKDRYRLISSVQTGSFNRFYNDEGPWIYETISTGLIGIPLTELAITNVIFTGGDTYETNIAYNSTTGVITVGMKSDTTGSFTISYAYRWATGRYPLVDLYSEGLAPLLYKTSSTQITGATSWNLVYKNSNAITPTDYNQTNPVECYAVPDEPIEVIAATNDGTIESSDITNDYLYLLPTLNDNQTISIRFTYDGSDRNFNLMYFERYGIYIWLKIAKNGANLDLTVYNSSNSLATQTFNGVASIEITNSPTTINIVDTNTSYTWSNPPSTGTGVITPSTTVTKYLNTLSDIDRTDAKLIKIIKIPYPPMKDPTNPPSEWKYVSDSSILDNALQLTDLNTRFNYDFQSNVESPMYKLKAINGTIGFEQSKNASKETKLMHSDFYRPKFVYDSFGFEFQLELVDTSNPNALTQYLQVGYVITSTINSKFLFYFPQYILNYSFRDFDNILPISRNNEVVLYTSQYINYLRTGYNYDVKARERQDISSVVGTIAAGIGGIAMGVVSQQPALVAMGIASFTSSVVATVNTIVNNEQQLATKQAQLKNQAINVEGSDDVDIMMAYSENRAYYNIYEVSPRLKEALFNLFYYTGYTYETIGVPNFTSRMYFNYLQCELQITTLTAIPVWAQENLIGRYELGITFLHNVKGTWDFEQEFENWETSLGGIY